jgi:hypothetical protein
MKFLNRFEHFNRERNKNFWRNPVPEKALSVVTNGLTIDWDYNIHDRKLNSSENQMNQKAVKNKHLK